MEGVADYKRYVESFGVTQLVTVWIAEGFVDVYLCQNSLLKNVHLKYASFIILKLYSSKTGRINLIVQVCFIAPLIQIMEKEKKKRKFITFL